MKGIAFLLVICLSCPFLWAQDIRTTPITWTVNQLTDLTSNEVVNYSCVFVTQGTAPIKWDQQSEDVTLMVERLNGEWNNIETPGKVTFDVILDGARGTLQVQRTGQGIFITLEFKQSGGKGLRHRYTVATVNKL